MRLTQDEYQPAVGSRPFLGKTRKVIWFIITLPFRVSLRLFFVAIALVIVVVIAETGVWEVPVVSRLLYRQPQPIRYVTSMPYSAALLGIAIESAREGFGSSEITITENQLTALIQEANRSDAKALFSSVQAVVHDGRIEVFGNLASRPNVFVTLHIDCFVADGKIQLRVRKIVVGHVPIPKQFAFTSVLAYVSDTLTERIFGNVSVKDMTLLERELRLHASYTSQ